MTLFSRIWDVFTGSELRKAAEKQSKASKELTETINKLSREEKALDEIAAMLKTGNTGQQNG